MPLNIIFNSLQIGIALIIGLDILGNYKIWVYGFMVIGAFFALMVWSMTRQWMPFVRLSEKVFKVLELPNPSNIDLVKSSKLSRTPEDTGEFGTFYFRY